VSQVPLSALKCLKFQKLLIQREPYTSGILRLSLEALNHIQEAKADMQLQALT